MKIIFLGASGGLGKAVSQRLNGHEIIKISSKDLNLEKEEEIESFFNTHHDADALVIFSNYNYNSFLHKYNTENDSELLKQINVNILGATRAITRALRNMRSRNFGRIIIASSITVEKPVYGTGIYAAAKAYMENLVKCIALENASKGITANCIQLGYMDGGLTYTLNKEFIDSIVNSTPAKRLGSIEEISNTINYIIENEFVNGTTIKLAGGL
jgi:NAD(P)-dependent dehydrogenase (short-subunit alcohol dehydrogenase family)